MTSQHVELAVAVHFDYRQNIIVPNIYWGMGLLYEADVVVLRPSNYGIEIEIKVSSADIKADLKKEHQHDSNLFKELWFAVPADLAEHPDIPIRAGILSIGDKWASGIRRVTVIRKPVRNKLAKKWTEQQRLTLLRLASMRTWALKKTILNRKKD